MDEKTRIFSDDYDEFSGEGNTKNEPLDDEQPGEYTESKKATPGYVSLGVGVAAGLGAGILATHFAFGNAINEEMPDEPSPIPESSFLAEIFVKANTPVATGITEDMSLDEAYMVAREQIGSGGVFVWDGAVYGTYNEEEWTALTLEQQNDYFASFNLIAEQSEQASLFDNIQLSTTVNDDMSFGEAFAAARSELGPGSVFMFNGNAYNTFYKEEWATMTQAERDDFVAGYLDVPDADLFPMAQTLESAELSEYETNQHDQRIEQVEDNLIDNVPVAQIYVEDPDDPFTGQDNDIIFNPPTKMDEAYLGDLSDSQPIGDNSFISEMENAKEFTPDQGSTAFDPDMSKNDFIHSFIYGGQNAEEQLIHNEEDILPDEFVSGMDVNSDLGL